MTAPDAPDQLSDQRADERRHDNQLIASYFSGRKVQGERSKMSFPHFLSLAWIAANEKAREIGWLVPRRGN